MTFDLSNKIKQITASPTLAVSNKAKDMLANGIDVINLGVGEPDFTTPNFINKYVSTKILAGETSFYTNTTGTTNLKDAIIKHYANLNYAAEIKATNIAVTTGAKLALYSIFQCLLNDDDNVVVAKPYWVSYSEQVKLAGGKLKAIVAQNEDYLLRRSDLEKLEAKPKIVVVNAPSNPTGALYSKEEILDLINWSRENDAYIVFDEIYGSLVYNNNKFYSALDFVDFATDKIIVIDGVSKAYAMTGWRIGWLIANDTLISAVGKLLGHMTSNPSSASQYAAQEALTNINSKLAIEKMRVEFEQRLNYAYQELKQFEGLELKNKPKGAFYLFPKVKDEYLNKLNLNNTVELSSYLLENAHVAVAAGEGFGLENHIRISYAVSLEELKEAIKRLKTILG